MSFRDVIVAGEWHHQPALYRSDQILVQAHDNVPERGVRLVIEHALGAVPGSSILWLSEKRRWGIVGLTGGIDAGQAAALLANRDEILFAEPDFLMTGHTLSLNDTSLNSQQWVDTIKLLSLSTPRAFTGAWEQMDGWSVEVGSADVLLAVFDSGIQMSSGTKVDHPDLADGRFILTHADASGDVSHDFWLGEALPIDEYGHGTQVTGILAATANNNMGIAGVNWASPVFIARVLDDRNDTCVGAVRKAMDVILDYADSEGYERLIVNMSLGSTLADEVASLATMMTDIAAVKTAVLICCAIDVNAEVSGGTTEYHVDYPSRYAASHDYVISVGETDNSDVVKIPFASRVPADPNELTVVAPGLDAYTTLLHDPSSAAAVAYGDGTGTSMACPMVAGVASLLWSISPWLTPDQIKQCLINTAQKIVRDGVDYFRIDANNAVLAVRTVFALKTTGLSFVDVPEGSEETLSVDMSVTGSYALTFSVVDTSGLDPAFTITVAEMSFDPALGSDVTGITVKYTAGAAGSSASGTFRLGVKNSDEVWDVPVVGNSVAPPAVALALVADTSGSMALSSGIGTLTRMDVLKDSLKTAVDVLLAGGACALVRFDDDAHVEATLQSIVDADPGDAGRTLLRDRVDALTAGGDTSIGDGAKEGNDLAVADTTRYPAVLVLTDGQENTAEFIADVMDDITAPVYAIGMGTAAVLQPAALDQLASATGGYLVLTDTLDDTNRSLVSKYCLQMLAEVAGDTVMVDPSGYVRPGHVVEIPFWLTRFDRRCDAIVLLPAKNAVTVELVTPSGAVIGQGSTRAGVSFQSGDRVSYYRLDFGTALSKERSGRWIARLTVSPGQLKGYRGTDKRNGMRIDAHGVPFDFMVIGRSGIAMRARSYASGYTPGSRMLIRAQLLDGGQAPGKFMAVTAHITAPDETSTSVTLQSLGRGVYEHELVAWIPGVYTMLIRAAGHTAHGEHFTREQALTSQVWNEPPATRIPVAGGTRNIP